MQCVFSKAQDPALVFLGAKGLFQTNKQGRDYQWKRTEKGVKQGEVLSSTMLYT